MAQYGKNNYFDGVILPEPKEEMLRRMAQGVGASKGYLESTDAGLLFDGPRSMECFFNLRQSDGTQRPAQFSTSILAIAVTPMDAIMFHCGNKSLQVSRATIGDDIHAAEGSVVKWLDSAPQLPEANDILPPLDASVGGYDLAAIGNPKIII